MLQSSSASASPPGLSRLKIEDFGELQARYQALSLSERASHVLADACPALQMAERIFSELSTHASCKELLDKLRKNSMLVAKLRPSEARVTLMDDSCDFMKETLRKLAIWRKTMERLASGEAIGYNGSKEFIRAEEPLALTIAGTFGISNYLSIGQLVLMELSKMEGNKKKEYASMTAEIRRCATVLSDYENALLLPCGDTLTRP